MGALVACSSAPEPTAESRARIIHGVDSTADQNAVVLIFIKDWDEFCSGTLLAPNLVLTARHCVSRTQMVSFGCDAQGHVLGVSGAQVQADYPVGDLEVFVGLWRADPSYAPPSAIGTKVFHDSSTNLCGHDVSLILLDRDIANAPIAPVRLDDSVTVGETLTAVGWGVTEKELAPTVRKQRANVKIVAVGPDTGGGAVQPTPPNDFRVGESICAGDSGGPALDSQTGAVVGVTSRGGNGQAPNMNDPSVECIGATNFYTQTSAYKDLILAAFAEAGHDPWVEGGPDPRKAKFGEPCATGGDCRSAICATYKQAPPFCSQDCSSDPTSCPSGYDCKDPGDGSKACLPHEDAKPAPPANAGGCALSSGAPGASWAWLALAALALRRRRR